MSNLADLRQQISSLSARRDVLVAQRTELASQLVDARRYVEDGPATTAALSALFRRVQEDRAAEWEDLLTSALRTILPSAQRDEDRIALIFGQAFGKATLDIAAVHQGVRQDIVEQRGLSVANIVATVLRYIILLQEPVRRFVAMDEPDIWISDQNLPAFYALVSRLACEAGLQTLLITHRLSGDEMQSEDAVGCIRLETCGTRTDAYSKPYPWHDDEPGIRSLRLCNVERHADSYLHLAPGLVRLHGDNEAGKSAVIRALRAVAHNAGTESLIRDGEPGLTIDIEVEGGDVLRYQLLRGCAKATYSLLDAQGAVLEAAVADAGGAPPAFAQQTLAFLVHDELDVHLLRQADPLFVLAPAINSRTRAEMLAMTRQAQTVQRMQVAHRRRLTRARETVREVEPKLALIDRELEALRPLADADAALAQALAAEQAHASLTSKATGMANLLTRMTQSKDAINVLKAALQTSKGAELAEQQTRMATTAARLQALTSLLGQWQSAQDSVAALSCFEVNAELEQLRLAAQSASRLEHTQTRLAEVIRALEAQHVLNVALTTVQRAGQAELRNALEGRRATLMAISTTGKAMTDAAQCLRDGKVTLTALQARLAETKHAIEHPNTCPSCGQFLPQQDARACHA